MPPLQGGCPGFESLWVHGKQCSISVESCPLSVGRRYERMDIDDRCTSPRKCGWEGSKTYQKTTGRLMKPCVRAIQASTGPVLRVTVQQYIHNWLLCQLVDSSAREPMTDVPSCDKLQGAAWRRRTEDLRMGIPHAIALRNGERTELKHLSRCRKRKQPRFRK